MSLLTPAASSRWPVTCTETRMGRVAVECAVPRAWLVAFLLPS